jgi:hypothetical protein
MSDSTSDATRDFTRELELLLAEREIRRVLERYCRGVDRCDADLISSCYHADSTDDHGMWQGPGVAFGPFCAETLRKHTSATQHKLGQSMIDVQGDTASCETYVVAYHRVEREGETLLDTAGARYLDRMERREGEWKIADRVVVVEWDRRERVEGAFPAGTFRQGLRSRDDLAYGSAGARQVAEEPG